MQRFRPHFAKLHGEPNLEMLRIAVAWVLAQAHAAITDVSDGAERLV